MTGQQLNLIAAALAPLAAGALASFIGLFRKHLPDGLLKEILVGERVGYFAGWAAALLAVALFVYVGVTA